MRHNLSAMADNNSGVGTVRLLGYLKIRIKMNSDIRDPNVSGHSYHSGVTRNTRSYTFTTRMSLLIDNDS